MAVKHVHEFKPKQNDDGPGSLVCRVCGFRIPAGLKEAARAAMALVDIERGVA